MMNGNAGNPTYLHHHVKNYDKLFILYICNDITHAHAYSWDSSTERPAILYYMPRQLGNGASGLTAGAQTIATPPCNGFYRAIAFFSLSWPSIVRWVVMNGIIGDVVTVISTGQPFVISQGFVHSPGERAKHKCLTFCLSQRLDRLLLLHIAVFVFEVSPRREYGVVQLLSRQVNRWRTKQARLAFHNGFLHPIFTKEPLQ